MVKAASYTKSGSKQAESITLSKSVFGLEPNHELLKLAYNAYLANGRSAQPTTLTRGLVRGGGRKPWRQKGTGRARVGSIRVPNWRGGGVVFGPTGLENHTVKLPIKMKRLAVRQALSVQASQHRLIVIEAFNPAEGKVKSSVELLRKLGVSGQVLIVVGTKDAQVERATRNIDGVTLVQATYLNVFDILNADTIIIDKPALGQIEQWLTPELSSPQPTTDTTPTAAASTIKTTSAAPKQPQATKKSPARTKTASATKQKPRAKS